MKICANFESMINNKKAVFFDLDGSLVDSMWIWKDIDIAYLAKFNIICPENLQSDIEGLSIVESAVYFKEQFGIEESIEDMIDSWNKMALSKYINEVPLKNGAQNFLDFCIDNNIKLAICSSNSRLLIESVLQSLKVKDYFDIIISGEDVKKGKPDPECYLKASSMLNVMPIDCLVFEDISKGIMAAINANMSVCAIYDEYSIKEDDFKKSLSDYYINDYTEIFINENN